MTLAYNSLGGV